MPEERLQAELKRLERQVFRLAALVDTLLDVSRVSRGQLRLSPERIDSSAVVTEVTTLLGEQLRRAGCSVVLEVAPGLVGQWDRLRLEQVVINLLTNVVRYAPGAPLEIRTSAAGARAMLTVRDHGPGISAQDRERIFRRFERAVSYTAVSGFGLGLFISRQIVEAHGGRLTLETELGRGSAFTVELPLDLEAPAGTGHGV